MTTLQTIKRRSHSEIKQESLNNLAEDNKTLLQRIFMDRFEHQEVDFSLRHLLTPSLGDIEKAAERIAQAIFNKEKILIVGDFDVDGATSIALMMRVLKNFGAHSIKYIVPNRFEDGYGLSPLLLEKLEEIPNILITVDNGISSIDGVQMANQMGITTIITDHHFPSEELPPAYAIVNPNKKGDLFESKNLSGVGVAFYLLSVVLKFLKEKQTQNVTKVDYSLIKMSHYLDLVALGTLADLVKLDRNNQILVQFGLNLIRKGSCVNGIKALVEISGKTLSQLSSTDIGFSVAPRLNSAGRLDDMSIGVQCLMEDDLNQSFKYAQKLDELNQERRNIEQSMIEDAEKSLKNKLLSLEESQLNEQPGIVLYDPSFHQGVIGIVASKIKEKWNKPVFIFAEDDSGVLKGSGRSVANLHLKDALDWINTQHPHLILKFGGHAMAAGLTLVSDGLSLFQSAFFEYIQKNSMHEWLDHEILSDGCLLPNQMVLETVNYLKFAAPWGQGLPEPIFDDQFEVIDYKILKNIHLKLNLRLLSANNQFLQYEGIAFFKAQSYLDHPSKYLHCAFKLDSNTWKDQTKLQLMIESFHPINR